MSLLAIFSLGLGSLMLIGAAIGLHRFPNALSRLHATSKVGGMATSFLLIALLCLQPSLGLAIKVILIIVLLHLTAAQSAQIIARSSTSSLKSHNDSSSGDIK